MILRNRSESVILQTLEFLPPVSLELENHLHPSFCLCLLVSGRKLSNALPPTMPAAAAKSLQLCPTLCDPTDGNPPSLAFSRQEHWSELPFPSPTHESEK